ncbi:MAG: DUF2089 domain-containing protein [candidate division Zixibacteria bacterium]|nr:DUF2089 domain-containing protein [candidate division Zixibacteria bacterium]
MSKDWQDLTEITGKRVIIVERVKLPQEGISIEGEFNLPPLVRLSADDQIFISAFIRCHGSIKQMEKFFGVSYPTIKNRLNKIADQLEFVQIEPAAGKIRILERLESGEISVDKAINDLHKGN